MSHRIGRPPHPDVLTPAEWRVLEQVRAGHPNAEIAVRLGISVNTVRYHVSNMLAKLEQPNRQALAQWEGEPRRRFGWLPGPSLPWSLGLGDVARWLAVGGVASVAVVVIAIVLAPETAEPRTSVAQRVFDGDRAGLVAMELATGAPIADLDVVNLNDGTGGFLGNGNLIWRMPWPIQNEITALDGARFGFGGSGFTADAEGVVQRWEFPALERPSSATVRFIQWAPGSRWVYVVRRLVGPGPNDELWRLDLRNPDATLLRSFEDEQRVFPTTDGRLFVLGGTSNVSINGRTLPSTLLQIDPTDGTELARLELGVTTRDAILSSDETTLYIFPVSGPRVRVVDLTAMAVVAEGPDEADSPRFGDLPWTWSLSPDERWAYVGGGGALECPDLDTPCEALGGRVHVIDLHTMEVVHEEPSVNQVVVSGDGRWLVAALLVGANDDSNLPERVQGRLGDGLKVIDAATFEVVAHLEPGRAFHQLAASADGRFAYALTGGPGTVDLGYGEPCTSDCVELVVIDLEQRAITSRQISTSPTTLVPLPR